VGIKAHLLLMVDTGLVAKAKREKCVNKEVKKMIAT
jgi:hypothetical protein